MLRPKLGAGAAPNKFLHLLGSTRGTRRPARDELGRVEGGKAITAGEKTVKELAWESTTNE